MDLDEGDEARRRRALQSTLEGCDRATRLVDQLLTLARLESTQGPGTGGTVDLSAVARQVAADLAPQAIGKRQMLEVEATAPCRIHGDESLLAALVRNIVDNAVRYSPPDARVRICVRGGEGGVSLTVEDSGPGMSSAELGRLGERFFRVAGSGESGSGLGWSIARRVAEVHGLELKVARSHDLGGLAVQVIARVEAR